MTNIFTISTFFFNKCLYCSSFCSRFILSSTVHPTLNSTISPSPYFNVFCFHCSLLILSQSNIFTIGLSRKISTNWTARTSREGPITKQNSPKTRSVSWKLWTRIDMKIFLILWSRETSTSYIQFSGGDFYSHVYPYMYKLSIILHNIKKVKFTWLHRIYSVEASISYKKDGRFILL